MSVDHIGLVRRLCLSVLLVLASGLFAQQSADQPLGDVARRVRSEREQSGSQKKVYTNEDFAGAVDIDEHAEAADSDQQSSASAPAAAGAKAVKPNAAAADAAANGDAAKREAELQKRNDEVNKQYTDRIAGIRTQIATAKQDLERLQREQVESTNQYRSSNGTSPSVSEYQQQQRMFKEQMEAQRELIATLSVQLEDAQEAARHAGVRYPD